MKIKTNIKNWNITWKNGQEGQCKNLKYSPALQLNLSTYMIDQASLI